MTEWAALGGHEMGRGRAVFGRPKRTRSSGKKGRLRKKTPGAEADSITGRRTRTTIGEDHSDRRQVR